MFPIRDDNPRILTPFATYGDRRLQCVGLDLRAGRRDGAGSVGIGLPFGLIPGELLQTVPGGTRFPLGSGTVCMTATAPSWSTAVTSMFLHGGWFHLIGNMWFLWIFGDNVEGAMGHVRFVVFYLLCGVAAAGVQTATNPESTVPMVGASGAIGGVMGAYVFLYPRVHVHLLIFVGFFVTTIAVPAVLMLGYWFLLQFVGGLGTVGAEGGGVAFWAHVGGFLAGAALVALFRSPDLLFRHPYYGWRRSRLPTRRWRRVSR